MASAGTVSVSVEAITDNIPSEIEDAVGSVDASVEVDTSTLEDELTTVDFLPIEVPIDMDSAVAEFEAGVAEFEAEPVDVPVTVDSDGAQDQLGDLGSAFEGVGGSASDTLGVGGAFGDMLDGLTEKLGISGAALGGFAAGIAGVGAVLAVEAQAFSFIVGEAAEAEAATALFKVTLDNTGVSAFASGDQFSHLATQIQAYSGFSDEAVLTGERLLLQSGDLANEQFILGGEFERTARLAADAARSGTTDYVSAMQRLARALADPASGVRILRGLIGGVTAEQREYIRTVQETEGVEAARIALLDLVESKVGGLASAYGDTLAGEIERSKEQFGEAAEDLGVRVLPVLTRLVEMGSGAITTLSGMADAAADFGSALLAFPTDPLGPGIDALEGAAGILGSGVADDPEKFFFGMGTAASDAASGVDELQAEMDALASSIDGTVPSLADAIANVDRAGEAFGILEASSDPQAVLNNLFELIAGFINFSDNLAQLPPEVAQALAPLGPAVAGPFAAALADAPQATRDNLVRLLQEAQARGADLTSIMTGTGRGMTSGLSSGSAGIGAAAGSRIGQAISSVRAQAGAAFSAAHSVGSSMSSGIAQGVRDATSQIISAAVDAVNQAVGAAKTAAKTGSPSRLTAEEIGAPMGEGIAVGIASAGSLVVAEAERIVRDAAAVVGPQSRFGFSGVSAAQLTQGGSETNVVIVRDIDDAMGFVPSDARGKVRRRMLAGAL